MTELLDEIQDAFRLHQSEAGTDGISVVRSTDELAPGFSAMRDYYNNRLMAIARRGYRHYAGSELPTDGEQLIDLTGSYMTAALIASAMAAFTDGVMIGHQADHYVQMMFHFQTVDHLFHEGSYRDRTRDMALGFAGDREVCDFFHAYLVATVQRMSHSTGFAHGEVNPAKIWDLWLLTGTAVVTTSYLAGTKMGASWRERDVLDGIEIASVTEGEDGSDR